MSSSSHYLKKIILLYWIILETSDSFMIQHLLNCVHLTVPNRLCSLDTASVMIPLNAMFTSFSISNCELICLFVSCRCPAPFYVCLAVGGCSHNHIYALHPAQARRHSGFPDYSHPPLHIYYRPRPHATTSWSHQCKTGKHSLGLKWIYSVSCWDIPGPDTDLLRHRFVD